MGGNLTADVRGTNGNEAHFDYTSLPRSVTSFLQGEADRIRRHAGLSIINIGKGLIAAKRYLSHGQFIKWVECELGIPARTAQAYMRVAQWAPGKMTKVAQLAPSLLYVLSSPSTPTALVVDVIKKVEAGERVVLSDVRAELRAARARREQDHEGVSRERGALQVNGTMEIVPAESAVQPLLIEVIAILARELSDDVFARVEEIMTRNPIVNDTALGRKIAMAFETIPRVRDERMSDRGSDALSPDISPY